ERGHQRAAFLAPVFGQHVAPFVANEAVAVEALPLAAFAFVADAIGGDHRHAIADRVADHRPAPHAAGVHFRILRLAADGGGIEQHFRAVQRQHAGGFRIPLVPAHTDTDPGAEHVPHLEPVVARAEIELLLVSRAIGNVALAVSAHDLAIGADHGEGVVIVVPIALEDAGRDGDAKAP